MSALVSTGALAHLSQLAQGDDPSVAFRALNVLMASFKTAEASDVKPLIDALRRFLRAFGPAGIHTSDADAVTSILFDFLYHWPLRRGPCEPGGGLRDEDAEDAPSSLVSSEGGRAVCELLLSDDHVIPHLCRVVQASPDCAFDSEPRGLRSADAGCEPFYAGHVLHYLDCYAGPAVAARLAALAPESVLRPVRAAAARGRWGLPQLQPP